MTCVVCMWLMSGSIVFEFHTFHSPAGSTEEANVSILKRADNVLDNVHVHVCSNGGAMGYRLRVYHNSIYQFY